MREQDEQSSEFFDERYWGCNSDPPVPRHRVNWRSLIGRSVGLILAFLLLMAMVQHAWSQTAVVSGGILCTSEAEIKTAITEERLTQQCQYLAGAVVAVATVVEKFHYNGLTYTIVEYIILSPWKGKPVQYGIMGPPIKELAI